MRSLTDLAADLSVSTEQVLVALRVVASRADVDDLAEWAAKELEGYSVGEELPPYRQWQLTVRADLYNPYQAFVPNAEILLKKDFKEAGIYRCYDGVGRLERVLDEATKSNEDELGTEHPHLSQLVSASLQPGWTCVRARAVFAPGHAREVVDRARQTALKFCLECEKKGVILHFYAAGDAAQADPQQQRTSWTSSLKLEAVKLALKETWSQISQILTAGVTPPPHP